MYKYLLPVCFFAVLAACQNNPDPNSPSDASTVPAVDTVQYRIVSKHFEQGDCSTEEEFSCARASVDYIEVTGGVPESVAQRINAQITGLLYPDTSSLEEVLEAFVAEYIDLIESEPDLRDYEAGWQWETKQVVSFNHPSVLTVRDFTYLFTGGAHGNYATAYLNFDLRTGERIQTQQFFKPEYFQALNELGEQYFRRDQEIPNGQKIQDLLGFWFPDDRFYLSKNVGFGSTGLLFTYAPYEIASYADGEITILIPYEELEPMALPGSALAAVIASRKGLSQVQ